VYELPFGRGRKFNIQGRGLDALVGGWEFSAVATLQAGPNKLNAEQVAAFIAAGLLSALVFPVVALAVVRGGPRAKSGSAGVSGAPPSAR